MLFRIVLATAMVVPMLADDRDRYDRRDNDRNWSRNDRRDDRREERIREERIREARRREAIRNNGRYNGNYGYGNNAPYAYGNNTPYGYGNSTYGYGNGGQSNSILNRTMQDLQSAASRNRVDGHERDHFNRAMSELQNMRSGAVDTRRLSRVLEDLDHLSNANQINMRDRQVLARDRQALASMAGGYGYNPW